VLIISDFFIAFSFKSLSILKKTIVILLAQLNPWFVVKAIRYLLSMIQPFSPHIIMTFELIVFSQLPNP